MEILLISQVDPTLFAQKPLQTHIEFGRPSAVAIYLAATVCQYQECEIRNLEVAIVNLSPKNLRRLCSIGYQPVFSPGVTTEFSHPNAPETVAIFFKIFRGIPY